jgi:hypothetical protein
MSTEGSTAGRDLHVVLIDARLYRARAVRSPDGGANEGPGTQMLIRQRCVRVLAMSDQGWGMRDGLGKYVAYLKDAHARR